MHSETQIPLMVKDILDRLWQTRQRMTCILHTRTHFFPDRYSQYPSYHGPGHPMLFWAPGARVQSPSPAQRRPECAKWWYNLPRVTLALRQNPAEKTNLEPWQLRDEMWQFLCRSQAAEVLIIYWLQSVFLMWYWALAWCGPSTESESFKFPACAGRTGHWVRWAHVRRQWASEPLTPNIIRWQHEVLQIVQKEAPSFPQLAQSDL